MTTLNIGIDVEQEMVFIAVGRDMTTTVTMTAEKANFIAAQLKASAKVLAEHTSRNDDEEDLDE